MRKIFWIAGLAMAMMMTASLASAGQYSTLSYAPMSDEATEVFSAMTLLIVFGGSIGYYFLTNNAEQREQKIRWEAQRREEELLKKLREAGGKDD